MQLKKTAAFAAASGYLFLTSAAQALAQGNPIPITPVAPPNQGLGTPKTEADVQKYITNAIGLVYTLAVFAVIVYLIWGAFEWITSGGDKEAIKKAQQKITNAFIGLAILAVAFVIVYIFARIFNIDVNNLMIKPLNSFT